MTKNEVNFVMPRSLKEKMVEYQFLHLHIEIAYTYCNAINNILITLYIRPDFTKSSMLANLFPLFYLAI